MRINGLGSNVDGEFPDRRFSGTALSAKLSTKSRTIKSLLEKSSRVKLGPLGKRPLVLEEDRSMAMVGTREARDAIASGGTTCGEQKSSFDAVARSIQSIQSSAWSWSRVRVVSVVSVVSVAQT